MNSRGTLTDDMKRVVREQRLGYVATVCPDGTPNLSPKGTTAVWDDSHLIFADIRSPNTLANLRLNPTIEMNVVDPMLRKGYRFKGSATVLSEGTLFDEIMAVYGGEVPQARDRIRSIVLVLVERALALTSPAYDLGLSEDEVRGSWERYWEAVRSGDHPELASE